MKRGRFYVTEGGVRASASSQPSRTRVVDPLLSAVVEGAGKWVSVQTGATASEWILGSVLLHARLDGFRSVDTLA